MLSSSLRNMTPQSIARLCASSQIEFGEGRWREAFRRTVEEMMPLKKDSVKRKDMSYVYFAGGVCATGNFIWS